MYLSPVFLLISLALISVSGQNADQYKIVETNSGQIRGIRNTSLLEGVPYYSFRGIPYAKPPVGKLRFKAPEPADGWKPAVLDAFEYSYICVQPEILAKNPYEQNEDCLTLNIFVPASVRPNEKLAVLFFMHGGGFTDGAGDDTFFGPDFIVEKQTILVTINYRLGMFGFLSLNLTEYSGNMGLKDQQLALKWVSSNIEHFGGDNKRITIFGQSAGGASTTYHILSAESRKYFRNAIPMSGTAVNYWAMSLEHDHSILAFQIAGEIEKPKKTINELVEFLQTVSADTLNQYSRIYPENHALWVLLFGPVVERSDAKQPFLVDLPEKLFKSSQIEVNTMFTITSDELLSLMPILPVSFVKELVNDFNIPLPFRGLNLDFDSDEYRDLRNEIRQFYFGDDIVDDKVIGQHFELLSDLNLGVGLDESLKNLASNSKGKTFFMWFSVDSKLNACKRLGVYKNGEGTDLPGAAHGDDLCYLFRCSAAQELYDEVIRNKSDNQSNISLQTIDYITRLYTNFAKYDEPSHQNDLGQGFLPIQNDQIHFVDLSNDGFKTGSNQRQKVFEFWSNIKQRAFKLSEQVQEQTRDEL